MTTATAQLWARENRFYARTTFALCIFIVVGFSLFDVMAAIDVRRLPIATHLHALSMVSWIALFALQTVLGSGRNIALHRKLGWTATGLVVAIVATSWLAGIGVAVERRSPPFFDPGYFLALSLLQPAIFATLVGCAIKFRKRTDWHRRLMLGSLVLIMEPLFGRLTVMGFVIAMGGPEPSVAFLSERQWLSPVIELNFQLGLMALLMFGDRRIGGRVHPAHWWSVAAIFALYALTASIGLSAPFEHFAMSLSH